MASYSTMVRSFARLSAIAVASVALLGGCQGDRASVDAPPKGGGRAMATLTPGLIAKSEDLLRKHGHAPLGTEYRFQLDGRRYVARIEEHDNSGGDPGRPQGKHKGVTVYDD